MIHLVLREEKPDPNEVVEAACGLAVVFAEAPGVVKWDDGRICKDCLDRLDRAEDGGSTPRSFATRHDVREATVLDIEGGVLDDVVHDTFSSMASELNNRGTQAQVDFLREQGWSDEAILREAAGGEIGA
jgi:hypothetical protein